jgi:hypothetical protein
MWSRPTRIAPRKIALVPVVLESNLDERPGIKRLLDAVQHGRRQPVLSHAHHRLEMLRLGFQFANLGVRNEGWHTGHVSGKAR